MYNYSIQIHCQMRQHKLRKVNIVGFNLKVQLRTFKIHGRHCSVFSLWKSFKRSHKSKGQ